MSNPSLNGIKPVYVLVNKKGERLPNTRPYISPQVALTHNKGSIKYGARLVKFTPSEVIECQEQ